MRQEEKLYYESQFLVKSHDIRQTWKLINSMMNKSKVENKNYSFKINNVLTNDKSVIVAAFNDYFAEIGSNLAKAIPTTSAHSAINNILPVKNTMSLLATDPYEVQNIISNIKNSSSCGIDKIPISVIKSVANSISPILSVLVNHSMFTSSFPEALKIAKITPIFKSGDKSIITNYRPISLLNTFSKIYERVF